MKIEITDEMTLAAAERYADFTHGKGAFASRNSYAQAQSKIAAQVILKAALPLICDAVLEEAKTFIIKNGKCIDCAADLADGIVALKTGAAP